MNEFCLRMSTPNQQSLAKLQRLVRYLKRERQWGQIFIYGRMVEEVTTDSDSGWACYDTRKSSGGGVILPHRQTDTHTHTESTHAHAEYHCKKQRRSRASCRSIGSVLIKRNCFVVDGSGLRDDASVGHGCEGHRTHPPQTRNWQIEAR